METSTTKYFRPVNQFIDSFRHGRSLLSTHNTAVLLDAGCGDHKYMCKHLEDAKKNTAKRNVILGQDNCREMLLVNKYPNSDQCFLFQDSITHSSLR